MTLPEYIADHLKKPFAWGVNDCVLFSVRWVELASGYTYLPPVEWTTEREALRAIKQQGGLWAAFNKRFKIINPNFAQDGDLAISNGIAFLFSGPHIASVGKEGLIFKSRTEAECAFTWREHV